MEKREDLKAALRIIFRSVRDFFRDEGIMLASYISYAFIMAIAPFCLFVAAAFGYLLGEDEQFYRFLAERLSALFPKVTVEITEELRKLITFTELGKWSLLLYGFLAFQLFAALQSSIDMVFKVTRRSTLLRSFFFSLVVMTLIILLLLAAFVFSSIIPILGVVKKFLSWEGFQAPWESLQAPWLEPGAVLTFVLKYIVPFLIMLSVAVILYVVLPRKSVKLKNAFYGGLFTAVMSEAAKRVFTFYVGSVAGFGTIYGSLTAFVVFLLWVFYSSAIFLIGGEITNNLGERT